MSKNQLSTCLRRDLGYDQYTPITEKEAYELAKTVVDLFEEYRIYYDVHRTEDEKKKTMISSNRLYYISLNMNIELLKDSEKEKEFVKKLKKG